MSHTMQDKTGANGGTVFYTKTDNRFNTTIGRSAASWKLSPAVRAGVLGVMLGALVSIPLASQAATTSYFNGNVMPNNIRSSVTAPVAGGTVEGSIGGRASAVLQTLDVFGVVVQTSIALEGAYTTASHRTYYDGRSRCYWYNWNATTPASANFLHCQVTT